MFFSMKKSIKKMVAIRVIAALSSTLLFSVMTTVNILRLEATQSASIEVNALLDKAQRAEAAHYRWSSNLSNALYAGTEFTGSIDPTTCVLGQWLYGEAGTENPDILKLRTELEPLHKELHASATHALELLESNPEEAQSYFQETIQTNLGTLVGLLDQVIDQCTDLSANSIQELENTTMLMHVTTIVCLPKW